MAGTIYHIFCTVTGKCYIGQTWGDPRKRWSAHTKLVSRCLHLNNAIRLYGEGHFVKSILTTGLTTQSDMDAAETYWIGYFDSINNGYNIREGGSHGRFSEETRAKMSAAQKCRAPASKETRAKIGAANKGKTISEETRAKMSVSAKGRTFSEETRAKIGAFQKGKIISEEARAKIGAANKGKTVSKETKSKMSVSMKEAWKRKKEVQIEAQICSTS